MKRRNILQVTAAGVGAGMAPWAFSQGSSAMLKPGKPYAGTEVNLLTVVAPQFKAHEAKLAEFEALTGIKVKYQYVPFGSTREKLTAELVGASAQYDVLSAMDVWGPSLYNLFEPLNGMLAEKKIDMQARYPNAHLRAARDGNGELGAKRGSIPAFIDRAIGAEQKGLGMMIQISHRHRHGHGVPPKRAAGLEREEESAAAVFFEGDQGREQPPAEGREPVLSGLVRGRVRPQMFDEMVGHDASMREAASTALSRLEVSRVRRC